MGGLYEGDALGPALREARQRTLAIYAHLDLATLHVPRIAVVNPPLWELGHLAWFQEFWCLRRDASAPRLENADALFDSSNVAHASRWTLPLPPLERLRRYLDETLEATLASIDGKSEDERYFHRLALLHEDMHGEALLMTLQSLGLPAPVQVPFRAPPASAATLQADVAFPAAHFELGTHPDERAFVFDNEKWAHPVRVEAFAIARRPVTQGEFADFIEDDGYSRAELWSEEGWAWREEMDAEAPLYWKREGAKWLARRFNRSLIIDRAAPMVHVTLHEAMAYCRWAGRRLPTEAEWEFAARSGGGEDRYPWGDAPLDDAPGLDFHYSGAWSPAVDASASRAGLRQMVGGVWEWTSTPFAPYPAFSADPYKDYSQPWFQTHYVLRGGSFATRSRLIHNRFRNFYRPDRGDVFAGFRTCAVG
jgi:iron(II)-dependent oxidoreductase